MRAAPFPLTYSVVCIYCDVPDILQAQYAYPISIAPIFEGDS
ncbi:MAG: hypothetical protein O2823_01945 [Actinomycetota bacterium]|nr:hypothetical protein [Actinomycetota bacterium]